MGSDENLEKNRLPREHFPSRYSPDDDRKSGVDAGRKSSFVSKMWNFMAREETWEQKNRLNTEEKVYEALKGEKKITAPWYLLSHITKKNCGVAL